MAARRRQLDDDARCQHLDSPRSPSPPPQHPLSVRCSSFSRCNTSSASRPVKSGACMTSAALAKIHLNVHARGAAIPAVLRSRGNPPVESWSSPLATLPSAVELCQRPQLQDSSVTVNGNITSLTRARRRIILCSQTNANRVSSAWLCSEPVDWQLYQWCETDEEKRYADRRIKDLYPSTLSVFFRASSFFATNVRIGDR